MLYLIAGGAVLFLALQILAVIWVKIDEKVRGKKPQNSDFGASIRECQNAWADRERTRLKEARKRGLSHIAEYMKKNEPEIFNKSDDYIEWFKLIVEKDDEDSYHNLRHSINSRSVDEREIYEKQLKEYWDNSWWERYEARWNK